MSLFPSLPFAPHRRPLWQRQEAHWHQDEAQLVYRVSGAVEISLQEWKPFSNRGASMIENDNRCSALEWFPFVGICLYWLARRHWTARRGGPDCRSSRLVVLRYREDRWKSRNERTYIRSFLLFGPVADTVAKLFLRAQLESVFPTSLRVANEFSNSIRCSSEINF